MAIQQSEGPVPTKDELEAENAELKAEIERLQSANIATPGAATRKRLPRPEQLSAGEVDDLKNAGVTVSPFDGRLLNALDEGIEPANPAALAAAKKAQAEKKKTAPEE
jgi:hypothetical protein